MFATQEQVAQLKVRALGWQAHGYPGADPLMPAVLDLLLQLPDIAPLWSCEGHYPDRNTGDERDEDFYIMFAATRHGWAVLEELYVGMQQYLLRLQQTYDTFILKRKKLREKGENLPPPVPVNPGLNALRLVIGNRLHPECSPDGPFEWCNVINFTGKTNTPSSKHMFFEGIIPVLQEMIESRKNLFYKNVRLQRVNAPNVQTGFFEWSPEVIDKAIAVFNKRAPVHGEFGYEYSFRAPNSRARHIQIHEDMVSHRASNMRVVDGWIVCDIEVIKATPFGEIISREIGKTYPEHTDPVEIDKAMYFKIRFMAYKEAGDAIVSDLAFITVDANRLPQKKEPA